MGQIYFPDGKKREVNYSNIKRIVFPDRKIHEIVPEYVQRTLDDKYVLCYLEKRRTALVPDYREIHFINYEWSVNPFRSDYDSYKFLSFDKMLSDDIIDSFPENMYFKIIFNTKKGVTSALVPTEEKKETEEIKEEVVDLSATGAEVVNSTVKEEVFVVLPSVEDKVDKNKLDYDMDFPTFKFGGEQNKTSEYKKTLLDEDVMNTLKEYIKEYQSNVIEIPTLPILELEDPDNGEITKICIVSCPDKELFYDLMSSEYVMVDTTNYEDKNYDNNLESSLHGEIPITVEHREVMAV
jgi:hypothetical protein